MCRLHNPPHPGEVLRELSIDPHGGGGAGITQAAEALDVTRKKGSRHSLPVLADMKLSYSPIQLRPYTLYCFL